VPTSVLPLQSLYGTIGPANPTRGKQNHVAGHAVPSGAPGVGAGGAGVRTGTTAGRATVSTTGGAAVATGSSVGAAVVVVVIAGAALAAVSGLSTPPLSRSRRRTSFRSSASAPSNEFGRSDAAAAGPKSVVRVTARPTPTAVTATTSSASASAASRPSEPLLSLCPIPFDTYRQLGQLRAGRHDSLEPCRR